ncbi:metallopeptidase TldD-related protein [Aquabacterium humicola]|uniref:metallopeptidase TldD-related protein n=1 Tax=Aquabacterium humicola TaxID=3237377 RepID=UPI00254396DF|nr:metallopeptidase TldD-related protein [Rubrivivax pictus]
MAATMSLHDQAEQALALMKAAGFDAARAEASRLSGTELNLAHNEPSLLRSTTVDKLALAGIVDGRMAATELSDLSDDAVRSAVSALFADARTAPQDDANALTAGQHADLLQGPQEADEARLADKVAELLHFRETETPAMMLEEGFVSHQRLESKLLSSGGSDIGCRLGWYRVTAFGTARIGQRVSSFNYAEGTTNDLRAAPAQGFGGIEPMLRDTVRQVDAQPIASKFVGDIVLTPPAVASLLGWLQGQLSDMHLIAGSSLYRERLGQAVAAPLLSLKSRFDAPGVAAISADGHVAPPVELLRDGVLMNLTPSLYGSRKTGLRQVPIAGAGWDVPAGTTPLAELLAGVRHGALVGRLSMGNPAPNGDFSGVIKNSFLVEGGTVGPALREVMVSGNIARMLLDVLAVSRERIDTGGWNLPWLRIGGMHFS